MTAEKKTFERLSGPGRGPLVTVLISTYNRPAYLAEALDSIFRQTWPHFEIILTRDGGLPVREVVSKYNDSRLIFIDRDQNRGLPYSFNEALARARGDYICYLGDDDKFFPHHIETLLKAILQNPDYGVVYGDLYKAHCRVLPDGRRRVLAKNVEISRDFDRMLMFQFNHALHVSLMHRRDLLDKAGRYNESLNVLIDWDLTRRLCFFTDFLHVPIVTGEYYAPVGDCDRISVQRRKNVNDYIRNLLTIRTTRPPKPWPCVEDSAIVVLASRLDGALEQMLRDIWSHSFYPYRLFVPLTPPERQRFQSCVPNLVVVEVRPEDTLAIRLQKILRQVDAEWTVFLPAGITIPPDEAMYIERSLNPLLCGHQTHLACQIVESDDTHFGAAIYTETLRKAITRYPALDPLQALKAAGIPIRKPEFKEYPFQFDNLLSGAEMCQLDGQWTRAARVYDYMAQHHGNTFWMRTRQANALLQAGHYVQAARIIAEINQIRPTVASLMIQARAEKKNNRPDIAIGLYRQAVSILEGRSTGYLPAAADLLIPNTQSNTSSVQPVETCVWT